MAQPIKNLIVDSLRARVYATQDQLVQEAAREVQSYLQQVLMAQGRAAAIFATGNSQIQFLRQLVNLGGADWSKITLFHMDEYLGISADHPASFRRYMRERVASLVNPKVFHYLAGDAWLPIKECERYAQLLRAQPIDLCCLGIGENGHLAFNDPPVADFNDNRSVKIVKPSRPRCTGRKTLPARPHGCANRLTASCSSTRSRQVCYESGNRILVLGSVFVGL